MKTLTLALFLAAWLPGGLLAATATTNEARLGGLRVELIAYGGGSATCTVHYINPAHVAYFTPSRFPVTSQNHGPFGPTCDRAASVEGIVLHIHHQHGRYHENREYLYNGTLTDFRRAFWNAQHP